MLAKPALDLLERIDPNRDHLSSITHADALRTIARNARSLHRLAELECNGPAWGDWSEEWAKALEQKQERCKARIIAAVGQLGPGFGVEFCGDPRGACTYIKTPTGRGYDWGNRGVPAI